MKKSEQLLINERCEKIWEQAMTEWNNMDIITHKKLRSCQATVFETEHYYYLRSYNTLVAVIEKKRNILVDVLRKVYGYTNTSAGHISRFANDYGRPEKLTYKEV